MRFRLCGLCIVVMGLVLLFTACGGNGGPDSEQRGENGAGNEENITLHMMHLWPQGGARQQNMIVNQIIEAYHEENPHVTIVQEVLENEQYKDKLNVVSASDQLPDIGMTWAAGFLAPFAEGGLFAPLNDVVDDGLRDMFVPGTLEAYELDGQVYGLPLELNIVPLYYNQAIFDQFGLEAPETFEALKQVVQVLNDNGIAPIALGNRDRWTGSMWYMYLADRIGGPEVLNRAIDRSGSFEDPALVEAAEKVLELVQLDAFVRGFNGLSNDEAKSEFINGQAAMFLMGTWELPDYTTNETVPQEFRDHVRFMKFPVVEGGQSNINSWVGGPGVGLFVAENSPVKEEAKKFVRFFIERWGELAVTEAGVIPATKVDTAQLDLPDLYLEVLEELNQAENLTLFADVQMSPAVADTHLNLIQALFGQQISPEEFARQHEEALAQE